VSSPDVAFADIGLARSALKVCVAKHIPNEKQKSKPNARRILSACARELDAILEKIPAAAVNDVRMLILADVVGELQK
jgi:hypothetical protein